MNQAAMLKSSMERAAEGGIMTHNKQATEVLSPTAYKKLNPANNHWMNLEIGPAALN